MPRNDEGRMIETTDRVLPPERAALQSRTVAQFESGQDLITQRYIPETREASSRLLQNDYARSYETTVERYLPEPRQAIASRSMQDRLLELVSANNTSNVVAPAEQTYGQATSSYYNPASSTAGSGMLADKGISVIPGGDEQSGNSNTLLIFLVLGAGVFAIWYYYKKMRGNN